MIHHLSIPARDPRRVAEVLAELLKGRAYPFVGALPGAYMAVSGDPHGTMIEVYPDGIVLERGEGDGPARFVASAAPPASAVPFHAYLSLPCERDEIEQIGRREGWRTKLLGRGVPGQAPVFHVIELWIENRVMLELVTEAMAVAYRTAMQFAVLDRHVASATAG